MAKVAFTVDNGIEPSKNTQGSVGSTTHKFLDLNFSRNGDIDGDLNVDGTLTAANLSGGGGGGTDIPTVVAIATALAY
tara:strand:- start:432 stop:665 length:234 start_codon:yes stop_codon:yes gene_type:complete